MPELFARMIAGQLEAALCMLSECIEKCPLEHWEGKIANDSFRQIVYHTLFFTDLYLSPNETGFQLRDIHARGGDERTSRDPSIGLSRDESLSYVALCRRKAIEVLGSESDELLGRVSGFSWLQMSRGEALLYNLRHIQHHVGQLSAFLRKLTDDTSSWWVKTGWRK